MKFEQEHTLPLLAIHATWAAVQQKSDKLWSLDKLLGKKANIGPMSQADMLLEAGKLVGLSSKKTKEKKEGGE